MSSSGPVDPQYPPNQPYRPPNQPYGPPNQSYGPSQPYGPSGATTKAGRRPIVLAALAGFVVAAVIAAVLIVTGVFDSDSTAGTSSDPVSMPKTLGSYVRFQDAKKNQQGAAKKIVALNEADDTSTAKALASAYGGAGAGAQTYVTSDLLSFLQATVVRGESPPPFVPIVSSAHSGTAIPQQQIKKYGSTYCLVLPKQQVAAGQKVPANDLFAALCQRSGSGRTATLRGANLGGDPAKAAALTDQLWESTG